MLIKRLFSNKILLEKYNKTLRIKLNNPSSKNALSKEMISNLDKELSEIIDNQDKNIYNYNSIIFESNTEGIFCTGADLKERINMNNDEISEFVTKLRSIFNKIYVILLENKCSNYCTY